MISHSPPKWRPHEIKSDWNSWKTKPSYLSVWRSASWWSCVCGSTWWRPSRPCTGGRSSLSPRCPAGGRRSPAVRCPALRSKIQHILLCNPGESCKEDTSTLYSLQPISLCSMCLWAWLVCSYEPVWYVPMFSVVCAYEHVWYVIWACVTCA